MVEAWMARSVIFKAYPLPSCTKGYILYTKPPESRQQCTWNPITYFPDLILPSISQAKNILEI